MNTDAIIQYYDDLMRLAVSKCGSQTEAEDLVSDTMLAAFSYINKGGQDRASENMACKYALP